MKRGVLSIIIAICFLSAFVFHEESTQAQGSGKKKLFISTIKAVTAPAPLAERVKRGIKLSIWEKHGGQYQILDEEAVAIMYKQAAEIMASGCDDKTCVAQIADGINADEIIYGQVSEEGGKVRLSLTNMVRDKETLTMDTKSFVDILCFESQMDYAIAEAGKKLMDKAYKIDMSKAPLDKDDGKLGGLKIEKVTVDKLALKDVDLKGTGFKGFEGGGAAITALKFTTTDETILKIADYLRGLAAEGDVLFNKSEYEDAREKYQDIINKISTKISQEKRAKVKDFEEGVAARVGKTYAFQYKAETEAVDKSYAMKDIIGKSDADRVANKYIALLGKVNAVPAQYAAQSASLKEPINERIESVYLKGFKSMIEKVDQWVESRKNPDLDDLKEGMDKYKETADAVAKIPQGYDKARGQLSEALTKRIASVKKAHDDLIDAGTMAKVLKQEKEGDSLFKDYKFAESLDKYAKALDGAKGLLDLELRLKTAEKLGLAVATVMDTGKGYLENRVRTLADLAEFYNIQDKTSDAQSQMKTARKLITGPMKIFATAGAIDAFNASAEVVGADQITQSWEPEVYQAEQKEKERLVKIEKDRLATIAQANFKKQGGGKTKTLGGIEFVYIPGGSFMMGSPNGQGSSHEHPQHKVTVGGFWMGKYEVTQKQYMDVMGKNPSDFKGDNNPVELVTWNDATSFCQQFSAKYGGTVRLPTEAEWEYACRAGSTTTYYWGDDMDGNYCWYYNNSSSKTQPVGGKLPNNWGLYDMSGNVHEWCQDWYGENYYGMSPELNPMGPASGQYRVLRGGAWGGVDDHYRSAYRLRFNPMHRTYYNGFRLVLSSQ